MSTQWRQAPDGRWQYLASDGHWYDNPYPPPAAPGYGAPGGYRTPGTNGMSIASMVLGIVWLWGLGSILALIFGYVSLRQIKERGENGRGMAIAGIVLGWIGVVGAVLFIVFAVVAAHNLHGFNCHSDSQGQLVCN